MEMPLFWENTPGAQNKGGEKGETITCAANHKARSWGWVYAKSGWATKTNDGAIVKQMPSLGEFSGYSERGEESGRWTWTLCNRPVSSAVDYFIANLRASSEIIDNDSSGHMEHKLKNKCSGK